MTQDDGLPFPGVRTNEFLDFEEAELGVHVVMGRAAAITLHTWKDSLPLREAWVKKHIVPTV